MSTGKIDQEIECLEKKIDTLKYRKIIIYEMSKLVNGITPDERQALFEILQDYHDNDGLGWTK